MIQNDEKKVVFIIAHKYFRGYESYLKYYVENILKFYGDNSLTLIVDNNSEYPQDVFKTLPSKNNVVTLTNNIECKFEIGAYQVGLNHVLDNNLLDKYDYFVFAQDTFVLKNKVNFNSLLKNRIYACPINSYIQDGVRKDICDTILNNLGINNNLDKVTFCWCNSFIVYKSKIHKLHEFLKKIVIKTKIESEATERFLPRILWELNEFKNDDIDGDIRCLRNKYNCWDVNLNTPSINSFFVKKIQSKNEKTVDKPLKNN